MSSAANAKPLVLAVGVADAGGSEGDGRTGDADAGGRVGENEAGGLVVTVVVPHAASSTEVATSNEVTPP